MTFPAGMELQKATGKPLIVHVHSTEFDRKGEMTSDHFYYMSTKRDHDGNIRSLFSPYTSPYKAFMNYMNVLPDFLQQLKEKDKMRGDDNVAQMRIDLASDDRARMRGAIT